MMEHTTAPLAHGQLLPTLCGAPTEVPSAVAINCKGKRGLQCLGEQTDKDQNRSGRGGCKIHWFYPQAMLGPTPFKVISPWPDAHQTHSISRSYPRKVRARKIAELERHARASRSTPMAARAKDANPVASLPVTRQLLRRRSLDTPPGSNPPRRGSLPTVLYHLAHHTRRGRLLPLNVQPKHECARQM